MLYKISVLLVCCSVSANSFLCVDKLALTNVSAYAQKHHNSRRELFIDHNFQLFDERYVAVDVIKANVTHLCEGMIKGFPRLETLSLINVNLSRIEPTAFQDVPRLKRLSLAVNHLTEIPKGVFNPIKSLTNLYLTKNKIALIQEGAFSGLAHLKSVHLDHNLLATIDGNLFQNCPAISLVDFSFNPLSGLSRNSFSDLRPTHSRNINIYLKKNGLSNIDATAFDGLNPVNLHLEGNKIDTISDLFYKVKEGSKINLNQNEISCVPDHIVHEMRNTSKSLYILRNPITCKCINRIENILDEVSGTGTFRYESIFPCNLV